ncbi:MAG TPA: hypothetical protein VGM41_15210 [Chitinophagaceae bacterium]|jgi:hypothetical protein
MKTAYIFLLTFFITFISCHKENPGHPPDPPVPLTGKLKDMTVRNLPSPAYHFEYNDFGGFSAASIYSGLVSYNIRYDGKKILRMESIVNKDTLQYQYYNGDLTVIRINDRNGVTYRRCLITAAASGKLEEVEWQLREGNIGYAIERIYQFSYAPNGNLMEMVTHMYAVGSQQDATYIDKFDNYDDKPNADGFSLLHPFQLEHLILLPEFTLQSNNPRHEVRTGDGVNYEVNYTYSYDAAGRPVQKTGDVLWKSGPENGKHFETLSTFSYY